jgi:hypothetical protein
MAAYEEKRTTMGAVACFGPYRTLQELARCLKHGNAIKDAARMLGRDEDEVRQKACDLGLIEHASKPGSD